jgi:hypothetical protein
METNPVPDQLQRPDAPRTLPVAGTIYAAVTPGYDNDPMGFPPEAQVERELRMHPHRDSETGRLWNREQKIMLPPRIGIWSLYLDGSLKPNGPVRELVEGWLAKADMALFKHPHRTCAYAEIDACVARNKITAKQGEKARSFLMLNGFPRDFGLWACGMIARRTYCNAVQQFAAPLWWHHVMELPRDQIWLPFVLFKIRESPHRIHTIDGDIFDNPYFTFRKHGT